MFMAGHSQRLSGIAAAVDALAATQTARLADLAAKVSFHVSLLQLGLDFMRGMEGCLEEVGGGFKVVL